MKIISVICITTLLFYLLTSCTTPTLAPTPTPTATIEPTPVMAATPVPTATPRTEPYSIEEAETILETLIDRDVTYNDDIYRPSIYQFDYEDTIFWVNKLNGNIATYAKLIVDKKPTNELIDKHQALQLAIQKTYENNPTFFDYDVDYEVGYSHKTTYQIYLTQYSRLGRKTGNSALAWVKVNGEIRTISIWDSEDPTVADKPLKISKEQALEIAYEVSIDKLLKGILKNNPDAEVELYDRNKHDIKIDFKVWKGTPTWHISIKFPNNLKFIVGYIYNIDANTGEVTMSDRYK